MSADNYVIFVNITDPLDVVLGLLFMRLELDSIAATCLTFIDCMDHNTSAVWGADNMYTSHTGTGTPTYCNRPSRFSIHNTMRPKWMFIELVLNL